jgi:hypothetical protein
MRALHEWENFYVIVASSAVALIELQFVVLTLVAKTRRPEVPRMGSTFGASTIVHFSAALLLSAIVSVPWHGIGPVAVLLGLAGLSGIIYSVIVARRLRTQTEYNPVFEDWLFHVLLPLAAHVTLVVSAFTAPSHLGAALYAVGPVALLLLLVGIHNAWDGVAYHLFAKKDIHS